MKKTILILIFSIILISFASAQQQSLDSVKQSDCIDLTQSCASCTYNNITSIIYPNKTKYLFSPEQNMTKSGTDYTFHTCNFSSQLGKYIVNGHGDLSGTDTVWNYDYEVTPTGFILETSDSITYIILTAGSILLFLLCLYGGLVLPFRNGRDDNGIMSVDKIKYFKIGLLFMSYVLFVWLLNLLFTLSNNFSILTQYTAFFRIIFLVMNAMSYPIFVFMLIFMSVIAWKDFQLKKLLLRGFNP